MIQPPGSVYNTYGLYRILSIRRQVSKCDADFLSDDTSVVAGLFSGVQPELFSQGRPLCMFALHTFCGSPPAQTQALIIFILLIIIYIYIYIYI